MKQTPKEKEFDLGLLLQEYKDKLKAKDQEIEGHKVQFKMIVKKGEERINELQKQLEAKK